jgi:hypothetical protein
MKRFCSVLTIAAISIKAVAADQTVFDDALQNGWENWSWAATVETNASPVHTGKKSIKVTAGAWEALYFAHSAQNAAQFSAVTFWLNGGTNGGQLLGLQALTNGNPILTTNLPPLPVNLWQQFTIPLALLGLTNQTTFDGFYLQERTGAGQPVFFVDDIVLLATTNPPTPAFVLVDVAAGRHRIDPRIYGVAYTSSNDLKLLNAPLNRQGGNPTSRYNWQLNADNRAFDYFFASLGYANTNAGEHGDSFIRDSRDGGAEPSLTIPMLDWVAKLGPGRARTWSYSVAKYGAQQDIDNENGWPDMGNGIRPNGSLIITNDPNDANVPAGPAFQQGWLSHLTNLWGRATNGGLKYYHLDNEMGIWHSTHQDVHPGGATMDEMRDKMTNYAVRIKATDPGALVLGPEEWHFYGAIFSGADMQFNSTNGYAGVYPDRIAHGGSDVYPYLLREMNRASTNAGQRLLDVCTVHYYPQGGEFGNNVSTNMQLLRNRSTRSLWDTNYVDESWLADNSLTRIVKLIPRLKNWVATNYPGTLTGITEYNWGAENHINGATAQADILGIFGREGLDLAERWVTPPSGSPTFKAMQMYRNYDGNKSTFGDISVSVSNSVDSDALAVFAAQRSTDAALTVMFVHKSLTGPTNVPLVLTNFIGTTNAQLWQLTAANTITHLADVTVSNATVNLSLPAQSITLLVLPEPRPRLEIEPGSLRLTATPGQQYVLEASVNFTQWLPISTNAATAAPLLLPTPMASPPFRFYRAVWLP